MDRSRQQIDISWSLFENVPWQTRISGVIDKVRCRAGGDLPYAANPTISARQQQLFANTVSAGRTKISAPIHRLPPEIISKINEISPRLWNCRCRCIQLEVYADKMSGFTQTLYPELSACNCQSIVMPRNSNPRSRGTIKRDTK